MSEPRHIYAWTEWHGVPVVVAVSDRADAGPDAKRHTLTEGEKWDTLRLRVLACLGATNLLLAKEFNAYFGEQP